MNGSLGIPTPDTVCLNKHLQMLQVPWGHRKCMMTCHEMGTFSALLAICAGNSPVSGDSWGWWFETPSHPLWHYRYGLSPFWIISSDMIDYIHDDVIKWKHFPSYWPFVWGIHRSTAQRPVTWSFDVFFDPGLNKRLSKQLRHRWFEMPLPPLWRHCNENHWNYDTDMCKHSDDLTHLPLVLHICVGELGQHWFR